MVKCKKMIKMQKQDKKQTKWHLRMNIDAHNSRRGLLNKQSFKLLENLKLRQNKINSFFLENLTKLTLTNQSTNFCF